MGKKYSRKCWNRAPKTRHQQHGNLVTFLCVQRVLHWITVSAPHGSVCRLLGCSWQSRESALPGCLSTSRVIEESLLRRATVADGCLHCRAESNFRFLLVAQTQGSFHLTQTFLKKALLNARNRELPTFDFYVGSSTDRWIRRCYLCLHAHALFRRVRIKRASFSLQERTDLAELMYRHTFTDFFQICNKKVSVLSRWL